MTRWIDQHNPVLFLARVADRQKEAFRGFVVRRMVGRTEQADGRCFETSRRISVPASSTTTLT